MFARMHNLSELLKPTKPKHSSNSLETEFLVKCKTCFRDCNVRKYDFEGVQEGVFKLSYLKQ
jgi:hypothetical protein